MKFIKLLPALTDNANKPQDTFLFTAKIDGTKSGKYSHCYGTYLHITMSWQQQQMGTLHVSSAAGHRVDWA